MTQLKLIDMDTAQARELGERVTIFAFALVEHYKAVWAAFSPNSPRRVAEYKYTFTLKLYGPEFDLNVSPNNDTVYAGAAFDLRAEPTVLQVPAIQDRYYSIQIIGCTTDDVGYIGTRATGTEAGTYLIAGPDWQGDIPAGITGVLRSPSRFVIAPARIAVHGEADLANVAKLQDKFVVMPLSQYLNQPAPPPPAAVSWLPFYDARSGDLDGFLNALAFMMQWQVYAPADDAALADAAALGVKAGQPFDKSAFAPQTWAALEQGFTDGRAVIEQKADHIGRVVNGWSYSPPTAGDFGTDYLLRSATAWKYIYLQSPKEAFYPTADVDANGQQFDGATGRYVLDFAAGHLPPVKYFWSVTLYYKRTGFLVPNPISRYSISDRTPGIGYGGDGSLRLTIQADTPEGEQAANWLPAPREPFYLILRCYGPEPALLNGEYVIPAVAKV
ncbi:MAG: DUF1214 domain-containing protein [Anaerolineae bacterium]